MYKKGIYLLIFLLNLFTIFNILAFSIGKFLDLPIQKFSPKNATQILQNNLFPELSTGNLDLKFENTHIANILNSDVSVESIYQNLEQLRRTNTINSGECHELSHFIGKYTYLKNKSLDETFKYNIYSILSDTNCSTGFYHGVIIGFTENSNNEKIILSELKKIVIKYEKEIYDENIPLPKRNIDVDMIHGVGHALYIKNNDVDESIAECEKLSENKEIQDVCKSGIYMEQSFEERDVGLPASILDCAKEKNQNQYACLVGNRSTDDFLNQNKNKLANYCANINSDLLSYACYKSVFLQYSYMLSYTKISDLSPICDTNNSKRKLICLEILHKVLESKKVDSLKSKIFLCSQVGTLDFLSCYNYLSQRKYYEMVFLYPRNIKY